MAAHAGPKRVLRPTAAEGDEDDSGDDASTSYYSGSNASSGSNSSAANSTASDREYRWTDAYPCQFYRADDYGCTFPRTCYDCLNVPVDGDEECMVNSYGRCVPMNNYSYHDWQDYSRYPPANVEQPTCDEKLLFPADEAEYCGYSDPLCQICQDTVFAGVMNGSDNSSLSRYCLGEHGCVCVAVCDAPWWGATIGAQVCHGAAPSTDLNSTKADQKDGHDGRRAPTQLILEIVGAVAGVLLIAAVGYMIRRRHHAAESSSSSEEVSSPSDGGAEQPRRPGAPQLSLFGWQAMRSELIEREQLVLAGVEDFSDIRTGYLQLLDVQASAPEEDSAPSSAPVLLLPLAGASAPPMSPSHSHVHDHGQVEPSAPDLDMDSDMGDELM